jgi:hypothetical protein
VFYKKTIDTLNEVSWLSRRVADLIEAKRRLEAEISRAREEIIKSRKETTEAICNMQTRLLCEMHTGHHWMFQYTKSKVRQDYFLGPFDVTEYVFKCVNCGTEIRKYESQLSATEIAALRDLGYKNIT